MCVGEALSDEIKSDLSTRVTLRQPIRIITDSQNRVTPDYKITQLAGECLLARTRTLSKKLGKVMSPEILLPTNGKKIVVSI